MIKIGTKVKCKHGFIFVVDKIKTEKNKVTYFGRDKSGIRRQTIKPEAV